MQASEVKKGDRVIFSVHNTEYNGIALSDAKIGVHPGAKRAGISLDIVYLSESWVSVKVLSVPVMVEALSESDAKKIVETEKHARERDHRRSTLVEFGGEVDEGRLRQELLETKQVSGWKPCDTEPAVAPACPECEGLRAELAAATADLEALQAKLSTAETPEPAQIVFETKHYADGSSATGVAPLPDVSPDGSPAV